MSIDILLSVTPIGGTATLRELGTNYDLFVVFVPSLGCIFGQSIVDDAYQNFEELQKLATKIVLVYPEDSKTIEEYFEMEDKLIYKSLLKISDVKGEIRSVFNLKPQTKKLPTEMMLEELIRLKRDSFSQLEKYTPSSNPKLYFPALFLLQDNTVVQEYYYGTVFERVDLTYFITDPQYIGKVTSRSLCGKDILWEKPKQMMSTRNKVDNTTTKTENLFSSFEKKEFKDLLKLLGHKPQSGSPIGTKADLHNELKSRAIEIQRRPSSLVHPKLKDGDVSSPQGFKRQGGLTKDELMNIISSQGSTGDEDIKKFSNFDVLEDHFKGPVTTQQKPEQKPLKSFFSKVFAKPKAGNEHHPSYNVTIETPDAPKSLQDVYSDKYLYRYFKMYLLKEMSVENLLFVENVNNYKKDVEKRKQWGDHIAKVFFDKKSICELNVSQKEKTKVLEAIQTYDEGIFDRMMTDLEISVISDCYIRFSQSNIWERSHNVFLLKPQQ
jgi:hypothetical protein